MAGHSQFKNIMHRKGAQDAKRAKVFARLLREIAVAVKEGGKEPESNSKLRTAMAHARQANVPNANIERILKEGGSAQQLASENLRYEALGPEGCGVLIEVLTDNRNRSACEIRTLLHKNGGKIADMNSISFLFSHVGCIYYDTATSDMEEALSLEAISRGAQDIEVEEGVCRILCAVEQFYELHQSLEAVFGTAKEMGLAWIPHTPLELSSPDSYAQLEKLISALDDHPDVQDVWCNAPLLS